MVIADFGNAACLPCVKNAGQLWGFARDHSAHLQGIVTELGGEWKEYVSVDGQQWFFNLRGYYSLGYGPLRR